MRFKQSITAALAAMAGVAISAGVPASAAQAATTTVTLPIAKYSHMLLDPAHQHLFFTSGSGTTSIVVTDYSGQTVATIPNEPGATGLALSSDSSTVYAALPDGNAVSAISTSTLAETARYATGTAAVPYYVAYSSGKIWFGYNGSPLGGIGSIDPSTSPATVTLSAAAARWSAAPMLAATAGGELVAGEPGQSPVQLASYDVSSGAAAVLAPQKFLQEAATLASMQITPDGTDVVLASGAPYYHEIYQISDLSAAGTYPTTNYPNSVLSPTTARSQPERPSAATRYSCSPRAAARRSTPSPSTATPFSSPTTGLRSRRTRACCSPSRRLSAARPTRS
jgi:hypothetical protein